MIDVTLYINLLTGY